MTMTPKQIRFCVGERLVVFACLIFCLIYFTASAQTMPDQQAVAALFQAIDDNDTNAVQELYAHNTNVVDDTYYARNYSQHYPLLQAAADGRTEIVALLLKYGVDPNVSGDTRMSGNAQMTALDQAARSGHLEICELLLKAGANPNHRAFAGDTALHFVFTDFRSNTNRDKIADFLLDYGANPSLEAGYYKNTPIELAITHDDGKLVPRMLGQDRQHPLGNKSLIKPTPSKRSRQPAKTAADILAERGAALLAAAAQRGELEAVQALLKAGVSAKTNSEDGFPLLQSFALSAAEAAKARSSAIQQLQQTRDTLERFGTNANPQFLTSIRSQEADQAAKVENLAPERWQQILALLIKNGADYDAFAATALGDTNQAEHLLGADKNVVQSRDRDRDTPLYWAVKTDQLPLTAFWLEAGASPAVTNLAGQTPLHIAAEKNLVEHMKLLLAARAPTDVRDTNGWTPLDAAEHSQNTEAIRLLLSDKSVAPPTDRAIATSVHDAATSGNMGALAALTETTNNLEARNELGLTPLQVAVLNGHFAEAALLVDRGANVDVRDPDGNTMLHQILLQERNFYVRDRPPTNWLDRLGDDPRKETYAKYLTVGQNEQGPNPVLQAASFLLACGVDAKATNHAGQTAVQLVADGKTSRYIFYFEDDQAALLKLLGSGGGNMNQTDADGNTALHRLCTGFYDVSKVAGMASLIASGADVNATNHSGQTPLHLASGNIGLWDGNDPPVNAPFQLLLYHKANVNAQDNEGLTPLHILASSDTSFKREATSALLDAGANPNLRDKHGRTPAHFFLSGKWPWTESADCMDMLVKAGADLSAKDDEGKTPLHCLAALGNQQPLFFMHGIDGIFVAAKVDFDARDNDGNTPLLIAAKTGTRDVFDWLVKQGANLDATNNAGETPRLFSARNPNPFAMPSAQSAETDIFQAVREGKTDSATSLLNADPQLVNQTNQFGQTPLRLAVTLNQTNMIAFLETHGAKWDEVSAVMAVRDDALREILKQKPDAVSTVASGKSLSHIAAANGNLQILETLIAANCDLQAQDSWGLSSLGNALIKKRADAVELLLQHGAKENFFDAVYTDDLKTVSTLLAQDKSLAKSKNKINASAVEISAAAGYADILNVLLKNGAPTDNAVATDEKSPFGGRNPSHLAAFYNQTNTLEILIRAGTDVNLADRRGFTPLHWAAMQDAAGAAALLLKHGAKPGATIPQRSTMAGRNFVFDVSLVGDTPLHLAALNGRTNVIPIFLKTKADVNAMNAWGQSPLDLTSGASGRMNGFFEMQMMQRPMFDLIEPLQKYQPARPVPPFMQSEQQRQAAALIEAAGGKRLRSRPMPGLPPN
jgi:ankyrin repeat protein